MNASERNIRQVLILFRAEPAQSLFLHFFQGKAWLRNALTGNMMEGKDMRGWAYRTTIELGFVKMEREELNPDDKSKSGIPEAVKKNLYHLTSQGLVVNQLFMPLNTTKLNTSLGIKYVEENKALATLFQSLMSVYMSYLAVSEKTSPFILGYELPQSPDTIDENSTLPDSLKPIGAAFNLFSDPADPDASTINIFMNTKLSRAAIGSGIHPPPPVFERSWLELSGNAFGKVVFSEFAFLETLILRPFFGFFTKAMHDKAKAAGITIGPDNEFDKALQISEPGVWSFDVHSTNDDWDGY